MSDQPVTPSQSDPIGCTSVSVSITVFRQQMAPLFFLSVFQCRLHKTLVSPPASTSHLLLFPWLSPGRLSPGRWWKMTCLSVSCFRRRWEDRLRDWNTRADVKSQSRQNTMKQLLTRARAAELLTHGQIYLEGVQKWKQWLRKGHFWFCSCRVYNGTRTPTISGNWSSDWESRCDIIGICVVWYSEKDVCWII